jgi:invasion protein IalB
MAIVQGEHAWIRTRQYDRILVEKMKKGSRTKVTGTTPKGTNSIDTYSLSGFTKAYSKMKTLCKNSNFKL